MYLEGTTGVKIPGNAIEARIAMSRRPRWSHTSRREIRSVATAVNGTPRPSIRSSPTSSWTCASTFSARIAPGAPKETSSIRRTSARVRPRAQASNSTSLPAAQTPPTNAPHRRAGDPGDLEATVLQSLYYADVRVAAGAAAPECQCDSARLFHPSEPNTVEAAGGQVVMSALCVHTYTSVRQ